MKLALLGPGRIADIVAQALVATPEIECYAVASRNRERAEAFAEKFGFQKAYGSYEEMLSDPEVQLVYITTPHSHHFEQMMLCLEYGKNVICEKAFTINADQARKVFAKAKEKGLYVAEAIWTRYMPSRKIIQDIIDSGIIGDVVGANCAMVCHGHETWHPDPEFYYKRGGGPMLDMGPYYITALVQLLGEAKAVSGMTKKSFTQRVITSEPHSGEIIDVDVDTYLAGNILFSSGAIAQVFTTFDVYYAPSAQARFEVYGTRGTLVVPDPNTFGGPLLLLRPEDQAASKTDPALDQHTVPSFYKGYKEIPLMYDYAENSRALGLADMGKALRTGRDFRANYQQQHHVLEILTAFSKASEAGTFIPMETKYERTAPMENNPIHGILD